MKRILAMVLALILALTLCVPAAAYSDEYWDSYDKGWNAGYDKGSADGTSGVDNDGRDTAQQGYEDGYRDGYDAGYEDSVSGGGQQADAAARIKKDLLSRGGTAGIINVMVDGKCLKFADVRPRNIKGCVMVPARATLEALGAAVSYDGGTLTAVLNGRTVTHTVGTDRAAYAETADKAAETVTMNGKSFVENGRAMVPVRLLSEALGCEVEWDPAFRTVVIVNAARFRAETDAKTSVLNLILADAAAAAPAGRTTRRTADLSLDLTVFDTLNGDKRFGATASAQMLQNDDAVNVSVQANLTDVVAYLASQKAFGVGDGNVSEEMQKKLRTPQLEAIYNQKTEELYLKSALLDDYVGADNWLESSVAGEFGLKAAQLRSGGQTVGGLLLLAAQEQSDSPFYTYDKLTKTTAQLLSVLGDGCFHTSGSTYTLTLNTAGLGDSGAPAGLFAGTSLGGDFSLTFSVTKTGGNSCDYSLSAALKSDTMSVSAVCDKTGRSETATVSVHVKNTFKATLTARASSAPYSGSVVTEPPKTAVNMDLQELNF